MIMNSLHQRDRLFQAHLPPDQYHVCADEPQERGTTESRRSQGHSAERIETEAAHGTSRPDRHFIESGATLVGLAAGLFAGSPKPERMVACEY
jgi:hypothetical protein